MDCKDIQESKKPTIIWSFFSSIRLTIALLTVIALASLFGTVIPQQEAAGPFVSRLSPVAASVFQKLQLFDIYRSIWFMALLVLLSINLIVCSINRLPVSWRLFRKQSAPDEAQVFRNQLSDRTILVERALDKEAARLEDILRKRYGRVQRKDTDKGSFLTGGKGNFSYFGVYLIHFGILIILTGAMIGFLIGFDAYVEIPEGESIDEVQLKGRAGIKKLDFTIRCDRFTIDYYEDGTPKVYRSDLTFTRNDKVIYQGPVLVNHPATVEGMRFYQANFGSTPSGEAVIGVRRGQGKMQAVSVRAGEEFKLPGNDGKAKIIRMEENLMNLGPAVKIAIQSAKGNSQFWVFENIEQIKEANPGIIEQVPMFNPGRFAPYIFSLAMMQTKHYTGLQVNSDPGLPVVVAGSLLLVLGFMTVFFYAHRQVWIRFEKHGTSTRITIAGKTNKDPVGLDREIARLIEQIQKAEVPGS
jgi:cytochrome c biogenesis protein